MERLDEGTEVHKVNDNTLKEIKKYSLSSSELKKLRDKHQKIDSRENDKKNVQVNIPKLEINIPKIPRIYKGTELEDRDHQKNALKNWDKSGYKGIFDHATGSGKTLTSIIGLCKLAKSSKTIAIVGVHINLLLINGSMNLSILILTLLNVIKTEMIGNESAASPV